MILECIFITALAFGGAAARGGQLTSEGGGWRERGDTATLGKGHQSQVKKKKAPRH